jgi:solute carrier family 30 (zinc transporter), member 1
MVQAAQEIAHAGSPVAQSKSLSHSRSRSRVPENQHDDYEEDATRNVSPTVVASEAVSGTDERTPLLVASPSSEAATRPSQGDHASAAVGGHSHGSMNMRALLLHVFGDALGNVGVIATGLVIWLSHWSFKYYFDPVISLVITVIIFSSALPLGEYRVGDLLVWM